VSGDLGAVRDLIEAGLNEPADAATRYGFCAATMVPWDRPGATQAPRIVAGDGERAVSVAKTGAAIGILGAPAWPSLWPADGSARWRTQPVIASAATAAPPSSMFGREPKFTRYRTAMGSAPMSRRYAGCRHNRGKPSDRNEGGTAGWSRNRHCPPAGSPPLASAG
jgi:hypothetical protein